MGDCVRCFDSRPAVSVQRMTVSHGTYDLALCDDHADKFLRDMLTWTRHGDLVEEKSSTFASRRAAEEQRPGRTRGGVVEVAHIHVPVIRVQEPPAPAPPPPAPRRPAPRFDDVKPAGFESWTFSEHARERCEERNVSEDEALWAAVSPDISRPGQEPGLFVNQRGHVKVVVNPVQRRIITVVDRRVNTLETETGRTLQHAASY